MTHTKSTSEQRPNLLLAIRLLGFVVVLAHPLDLYRVTTSFVSVSLFRISGLFLILLFGYYVLQVRINFRRDLLGLVFLFLLGTFLTLINTNNIASAAPVILRHLLLLGIVVTFTNVYSSTADVYKLAVVLLVSYVLYFAFVVITFHHYLQTGAPIAHVPFSSDIPLNLGGAGHLADNNGFQTGVNGLVIPRVTLPYTTPPLLSLAYGLGVVLSLGLGIVSRDRKRSAFFLIVFFLTTVGLLGTVSRSGLFATIGGVGILIGLLFVTKDALSLKQVLGIGLLTGCVLSLVFPIEVVVNRIITADYAGHINSRLDALRLWADFPVIGVGLEGYILYTAESHAHATYMTILAERGIVGSVLYWPLFFYPVVLLTREGVHAETKLKTDLCTVLIACLMTIIGGAVLYENTLIIPVWIVLAMIFALLNARSTPD